VYRGTVSDFESRSRVVLIGGSSEILEKPDEFIPERFLGNYNKDALLAFSIGEHRFLIMS